MRIKEFDQRRQTRRKVHGIAAALLPYERAGRIAVEAFQRHLVAAHHAGLMNAVNMDTVMSIISVILRSRMFCAGPERRSAKKCRLWRELTSKIARAMLLTSIGSKSMPLSASGV